MTRSKSELPRTIEIESTGGRFLKEFLTRMRSHPMRAIRPWVMLGSRTAREAA